MSLQEFEKLQRELHHLHGEREALRAENAAQKEQLQHLEERVEELQAVANNHPIRLIAQRLDPLAPAASLLRLEDALAAQAYQLAFLQQLAEDKSLLLLQAHRNTAELERAKQELRLQVEVVTQRLREAEARDERARREASEWQARLQRSHQEHLHVLTQKEDLAEQLRREQAKNHAVLLELAAHVAAIREAASAGREGSEGEEGEWAALEGLAAGQQEELRERNQEIARLKAVYCGPVESGEANLKNTIRHLRGELTRYGNLMQHVTDKLALAESAISRYSTSADRCKQELASVGQLRERVQSQAGAIRVLEEEVRVRGEELQRERKAQQEGKKLLVEALKENQCFHEFLFLTYGDTFQQVLSNERQDYENRLAQRTQREKWATVEELVNANEHLRARLKIA